jgi:HTH-type transcriptional regulator, sugar sensing transcriptional regulator
MYNIKEVLQDLGFEDRETKVYLDLIREGDLTALKISRDTGIDRTTIYDILEKLISQGVVSSYIKNNSKTFHALPPKDLLNYFKDKYNSLEKILPELEKMSNSTNSKVICELYQGKEGMKTILKELINRGKDYKVIGIRKEYEDILGFFNESGVLKMDEFKAKEIAIVESGTEFKKLKNSEYRYLGKKLLSSITTLLYGDNVVFFIWTEPYFAICIRNNEFRKMQEEYFDLLWNISRKQKN